MKIIFMGTPDYAKKILQRLIDTKNIDVVAVYTQPDKTVGRKQIMTSPEVKILAKHNKIDVYQPNKLRDEEVVKNLLKIKCDYIIVAAYGQILPKDILSHAPCINLHASILPAYRGASPIQQTLLNEDRQTGITAMLMGEGLDTGEIIKILSIDVDENEMLESLFDRLTKVAQDLIIDVLENFISYKSVSQDDKKASHCKKISKIDGEIDFENAVDVYNKYRAFTPWPGVYLSSGLKLKSILLEDRNCIHERGKIVKIEKDYILVACTTGVLRIYTVQPASKKEMSVLSYINGKRLSIDNILS